MERTIVKDVIDVGTVSIANDVVAVIAGIAAAKVNGIAGMSGGLAEDFARRVSGRNSSRGVTVEVEGEEARIDLRVIVEYGVVINEVCCELQHEVKQSVESMTGLDVISVNIKVDGVDMLTSVAE